MRLGYELMWVVCFLGGGGWGGGEYLGRRVKIVVFMFARGYSLDVALVVCLA